MNREGTQPYIYTYPFSPKRSSHPACHIVCCCLSTSLGDGLLHSNSNRTQTNLEALTIVQINSIKKQLEGTYQVAQWLRIYLPMQGAQVQPLVWGDPVCHRATTAYFTRANTTEPMCTATTPAQPVLRDKTPQGAASACMKEQPLPATAEKPERSREDSAQPNINNINKIIYIT